MLQRLVLFLGFTSALSVFAGDSVAIPPGFRTCVRSSDCAEVETLCSGCCGFDTVHKKKVQAFGEIYGKTCEGHGGPVCDCAPAPGRLECRQGSCRRVLLKKKP